MAAGWAALLEKTSRPVPKALAEIVEAVEDSDVPLGELIPHVLADLRQYQETGVRWLTARRNAGVGVVLADEMGLGKTLQTICALRGDVLVVVPKSLVDNWADELAKFSPEAEVRVYHGARRSLPDDRPPGLRVVLTTYGIMRSDRERLASLEWDVLVLDEAHHIKNAESQAFQAATSLKAGWRIALTGTPVENSLRDLWSLQCFANPGLLGGLADFEAQWVKPIETGDRDRGKLLAGLVKPTILRRKKADVAPDLPPRNDALLRCSLSDEEAVTYNALLQVAQSALQGSSGGSMLAVLEALLRLRQAAADVSLVPGSGFSGRSAKVSVLMEKLEEVRESGHKALIFSQWTSFLDRIEGALDEQGWRSYVRLDGTTKDRRSVVEAFQEDNEIEFMLISLKAGGVGLNLTAADHVFLMDPWWNPAVEDQAADRAHRIGRVGSVSVYKVVTRNTVEERILELQERKRQLSDLVLDAEFRSGSSSLTREDLEMLLSP